MKHLTKRGISLLLVLALLLSLLAVLGVTVATTVDYVISNDDYIYSWSNRGEIATFQ